jgi:TonB family protein
MKILPRLTLACVLLLNFGFPVRAVDDCENSPTLVLKEDGRTSVDVKAWRSFKADMARRVLRAWVPPRDGRGVEVEFVVKMDGSISNLRVGLRSGSAICDQAALKAVTDAVPFGRLPQGAEEIVRCRFGLNADGAWPSRDSMLSVCLRLKEEAKLTEESDKAMSDHRYLDAVAIQDRLLELEGPNCISCRKLLAALDSYAVSLKMNPASARKQLYRALSLDNNFAPARAHLNEIVSSIGIDPVSFTDRVFLARREKEAGELEMACGEYREALRLHHDNVVQSELKLVNRRMDLKIQLDSWKEFLKEHPDSVQGHLGMGQTLERLDLLKEAEKEYRQAMTIDPFSEAAKELLEKLLPANRIKHPVRE